MRLAIVCLLVAACGDNAVTPDALVVDAIDAPLDTPTPPPGCSWAELYDTANETVPEDSNVTFASSVVLCGRIDIDHANDTTLLVDTDALGFELATETAIRVELAGAFTPLAVELSIVNRFGDPLRTTQYVGTHAVAAARLPAGSYGIAIRAIGPTPAVPVEYQATITADMASCHVTTAASYTESAAANDVVEVRFTGEPALRRVLTAAADAPEPTGVTFAPGASARFTGTSANVDAADDYRDRDTYVITTGANTDTLAVRLDWIGAADLDFFVFPAGVPELAGASQVTTAGPELATFAVLPSTTYWLWIGAYDSSSGLPVTYDASICAE